MMVDTAMPTTPNFRASTTSMTILMIDLITDILISMLVDLNASVARLMTWFDELKINPAMFSTSTRAIRLRSDARIFGYSRYTTWERNSSTSRKMLKVIMNTPMM